MSTDKAQWWTAPKYLKRIDHLVIEHANRSNNYPTDMAVFDGFTGEFVADLDGVSFLVSYVMHRNTADGGCVHTSIRPFDPLAHKH
jgi:hypothetical protein